MSTQRLALLSLTGAGERYCEDCVYLDRSHCDAMGAPMPVSAVPWRLPECLSAERDAARLRAIEAAAKAWSDASSFEAEGDALLALRAALKE